MTENNANPKEIDLVVTGTVAIDNIKTDEHEMPNLLGGAATYASIAASKFCSPAIVSITGADFPKKHIDLLHSHNIDTRGIKQTEGKTFFWSGSYTGDMDEATTLDTQLNVLMEFKPEIPDFYKSAKAIMLGNLDPDLQLDVLEKNKNVTLSACDTMNFWIINTPDTLKKVLSKVDIIFINEKEATMFTGEIILRRAADKLLSLGAKYVVIKKGKHGSAVFSHTDEIFFVPSYPLHNVVDPTGAGDSFAGAFMGYLSKMEEIGFVHIKKALIYGTAVASHTISDFSVKELSSISLEDIEKRCENLMKTFIL